MEEEASHGQAEKFLVILIFAGTQGIFCGLADAKNLWQCQCADMNGCIRMRKRADKIMSVHGFNLERLHVRDERKLGVKPENT